MPLAYICAPYTEKSVIKLKEHVYGEIESQSFKSFLETIESLVRESGFSTFLPHRDIHQWGKIYIEPEIVMKNVWDVIKTCDLFVVCPEHARGPNVELGLAAALGKKSIIIQHEAEQPSLVHVGLNAIASTNIVKFRDIMDMKTKLRTALSELKKIS